MGKNKLTMYIGIFLVVWIVIFIADYMFLKSTVEWPEEEPEEEIAVIDEEDRLGLLKDISYVPPVEVEDTIPDLEQVQKAQIQALVDSLVNRETEPLRDEIDRARKELKETREQIDELEELLKTISSQEDSIDVARARRLSKMLESMKPDQAANILAKLSSPVNVELLMRMRQKTAAKILSELPQSRAEEIARHLSRAYGDNS